MTFDQFRNSLSLYQGVRRRFEILGEAEGITVIDDYAHHPTEIRATLAAAQSAFPEYAIWAIFQPHTYSRLQEFYDGFINSFDRADAVLVTEVFAAREAVGDKVSGRNLHRILTTIMYSLLRHSQSGRLSTEKCDITGCCDHIKRRGWE